MQYKAPQTVKEYPRRRRSSAYDKPIKFKGLPNELSLAIHEKGKGEFSKNRKAIKEKLKFPTHIHHNNDRQGTQSYTGADPNHKHSGIFRDTYDGENGYYNFEFRNGKNSTFRNVGRAPINVGYGPNSRKF